MSNEIISKWLGECRHNFTGFWRVVCNDCGAPKELCILATDYLTDPAAWSPELFQEIEDDDLEGFYAHALMDITGCPSPDTDDCVSGGSMEESDWIALAYLIARATPLQKATALAKAITERNSDN